MESHPGSDAPALAKAQIGIAVAGATDAAQAAADIILTREGLSPIMTAIEESRKIFKRLKAYVIYRICVTVQVRRAIHIHPQGTGFEGRGLSTLASNDTSFVVPLSFVRLLEASCACTTTCTCTACATHTLPLHVKSVAVRRYMCEWIPSTCHYNSYTDV